VHDQSKCPVEKLSTVMVTRPVNADTDRAPHLPNGKAIPVEKSTEVGSDVDLEASRSNFMALALGPVAFALASKVQALDLKGRGLGLDYITEN